MHRIYPKFVVLFSALFLSVLAFAQTPSIGVQVSPTTLCVGDVMTVIFATSDTFAADNVYTILLSDSSGSFADADTLDTISGQAGDTLYIPTPLVPAGSNYKVAVYGSDPQVNGAPTISNITIKKVLPAPSTQLTPPGPVLNLCKGDSVKFKFSSFTHLNFTWFFNDSLFVNPAHYTLTDKDSGSFIVEYVDTTAAGCARGFDTVLVAVHAFPAKPTIGVLDKRVTNFCGSGIDTLYARNNPTLTYQWVNTLIKDTISSASDTSLIVDTTGVYEMLASNQGCPTASNAIAVNIDPYPVVTLAIPSDSFCLHSPPILLTGGLPNGGFYTSDSADYTSGDLFEQSASGLGTFTVYYTFSDAIGCSSKDSQQISIYDCTTMAGISSVQNEIKFSMYPNPASGAVIISAGDKSAKQMRLLNLMGEEIDRQKFEQQLVYDTHKLPAGIYMVEISDATGTSKSVQRLVVQ